MGCDQNVCVLHGLSQGSVHDLSKSPRAGGR
jgi:hypothetical protein